MNAQTIFTPDIIFDAIGVADPDHWKQWFETMRQAEYERIRVMADPSQPASEPLTSIPVRVRLLDELEHFFLDLRKTPADQRRPANES